MQSTSETERRQKVKDRARIDLEPCWLRDSDTGRQITTVPIEGNVRVWPASSHSDLTGWHVASPAAQIFWDAPLKCNGAGSPARTLTFGSPGALALSETIQLAQLTVTVAINQTRGREQKRGTSKSDFNLAGCRPRQAYGSFTPDDRHGTHLFVQHGETHPIRSDRRWKSWINPSLRLEGAFLNWGKGWLCSALKISWQPPGREGHAID